MAKGRKTGPGQNVSSGNADKNSDINTKSDALPSTGNQDIPGMGIENKAGTYGTLYLCATPIGNLEDITLRTLRILKEVDLIAAEDTRQTMKLLNHFDIHKPLTSYYEHNKKTKGNALIQRLLSGESIALVSDAGTPGISDPGEDLVKLAVENGIKVTMTPGASALIMGVVLSGLPSGRFVFEGFLPVNKRVRKERLSQIVNEKRTMIFYEAPHKLVNTLDDLLKTLGNRRISIARELTKMHEEIWRTTLEEAGAYYRQQSPRGEYVLVVEGSAGGVADEGENDTSVEKSALEWFQYFQEQGFDRKEAMKKAALKLGISKKDVYNSLLLEKQGD